MLGDGAPRRLSARGIALELGPHPAPEILGGHPVVPTVGVGGAVEPDSAGLFMGE